MREVGILELIHHDVLVGFLQFVRQLWVGAGGVNNLANHIIKIVQLGGLERGLVALVYGHQGMEPRLLLAGFEHQVATGVFGEPLVLPGGERRCGFSVGMGLGAGALQATQQYATQARHTSNWGGLLDMA